MAARFLLAGLAAAAIASAPAAASAGDGGVGSWYVTYSTSTLDDSPEVYAEDIVKTAPVGDDQGRIGKLMGFCKDRKAGLLLDTKGFWGLPIEGRRYAVAIRIDGAAAVKQAWPSSTTGDAAFYPGSATAFLSSLMGKKRLFLRIVDGLGREHEATFDIDGAPDVAKLISLACARTAKAPRGGR